MDVVALFIGFSAGPSVRPYTWNVTNFVVAHWKVLNGAERQEKRGMRGSHNDGAHMYDDTTGRRHTLTLQGIPVISNGID